MEACNQRQSRNKDTGSISVEVNIPNQSRRNKAILLSRTADRSHLFRASNDCLISILSYLGMKDVCRLDIAVTNSAARIIWMSSLQVTNQRTMNECTHNSGSIRWLVTRGVRLESLKVKDGRWFTLRMKCSALLGLDLSLLRDVSFRNCNIGDEEVIALAQECPHLSEICLHSCKNITDIGVSAIADNCPLLNSIDLSKCG